MKAIQGLLVILFVFFLSTTAFAKADSVESGIAPDAAAFQMAASQAGSGEPVNYSKGKGTDGNEDSTSGKGTDGDEDSTSGKGKHGDEDSTSGRGENSGHDD